MVISSFQALRHARVAVAGHEPATRWFLNISGRIRYPLCHRRPREEYVCFGERGGNSTGSRHVEHGVPNLQGLVYLCVVIVMTRPLLMTDFRQFFPRRTEQR
ncbi:hypothetical protein PoB_007314100 [Plakobranchus ocellatus]|uniref:Uncharacterized protein n=1 Tax=Plakobranchus ocellatus TaxID=259542 RepID=A0AAV4DS22_9GAST|nr:hypothetical protein PoB_007314100 [Plakobranchus ocellatus]